MQTSIKRRIKKRIRNFVEYNVRVGVELLLVEFVDKLVLQVACGDEEEARRLFAALALVGDLVAAYFALQPASLLTYTIGHADGGQSPRLRYHHAAIGVVFRTVVQYVLRHLGGFSTTLTFIYCHYI